VIGALFCTKHLSRLFGRDAACSRGLEIHRYPLTVLLKRRPHPCGHGSVSARLGWGAEHAGSRSVVWERRRASNQAPRFPVWCRGRAESSGAGSTAADEL